MPTLLLITKNPHSRTAKDAVNVARQLLDNKEQVRVFFYGDGAHTANRLMWQTADVMSVSDAWVMLADEYSLDLPVCVSTALARGITDADNAKRHGLDGENLRKPFRLVGLSELALQIKDDTKVMQF
ncbi:sulfurtransferase complex subunit TusD [Moraxella sp. Tifton1]|uniref:Sulfurtransferase complex subunit TusD n=1 Tax=Moraxella oculi TaxID=2940516 RepID=A0ABW8U7X5_9GAMM|nr:sulfurtransferase complex subunit TusD [Moraxella sp. Tifton1]MCL1622714.1 sulfurtransferase complex subunit TusD [Moraxella sp. Tifton1]